MGDREEQHSGRRSRRRAARLLALIGGVLHAWVPQLLVLPQDPQGPTIGVPATTVGLFIIGSIAVAGAVLSGRLPSIGRALVGTAAILSVFLIVWEFRPTTWLISAPLVVAALLPIIPVQGVAAPTTESRREALGAIAVSGYLIWRMLRAYNDRFLPTHDESVATKPDWEAEWLWVGGVTSTTARVSAGGLAAGRYALTYWSNDGVPEMVVADANTNGVARFDIDGLTPGSDYSYSVGRAIDETGLDEAATADANFRTPSSGAQNVTIAFGSCASTGSNGAVFDAIRATDPDLFVQLGDLHYGNLTSRHPADHIEMLGRSISTPAQSALYSSVPSAWIWDDHDYGPNDSDSTSPARAGALGAYRQAVPHWSVASGDGAPINQAFTIGRVRVITSDTRSQRTAGTMLGPEQEAWLIRELVESAATQAVVVWAMPTPWNFPEVARSDVWGGFPEERRRIANAIAAAQIDNLVMISGDWHLSAIDDGTNTSYADDGYPGFPLIHGAPLDRPGSRTNQPHSHGVFSNAGQFGTVEVFDDGGDVIDVRLTVRLWNGDRLGELSLSMSAAA